MLALSITALPRRTAPRAVAGLAVAFLLACLAPGAALAVDVQKGGSAAGSDLEVIAGGEDNNISITGDFFDGDKFWIEDTLANVTAGAGCIQEGPKKVSCNGVAGIPDTADFYVHAGGGNDTVSSIKHAHLFGGDGNDTLKNPDESIFNCGWHSAELRGDGGNDRLEGGCDPDTLVGGDGDDTLDAGSGDDYMDGGTGIDDHIGWTGWDKVDYSSRTTGTYVTLDDVANDGGSPEDGDRQDNVRGDIEEAHTGSGHDLLVGNDWDNVLVGNGSPDHVEGRGGNDDLHLGGGADLVVFAGSGNDEVYGGDGNDKLYGDGDQDVVDGQGDDDLVAGGPGSDDLRGGDGGNDRANYQGRTNRIVADLDGGRDDGEAGENDVVAGDMEGLEGGDGSDILTGNGDSNRVFGGPGPDSIDGGGGDDTLAPNHSTNTHTRNDSGDGVIGGDGTDTVDYRSIAMEGYTTYVKLDGNQNDGVDGEGDNVLPDVENVKTSTGNDVVWGDGDANSIDTGAGDDAIDGLGGADDIVGGPGTGDIARFVQDPGRVVVSLDNQANDGADPDGNGASDVNGNVHADVEQLVGSPGRDRLEGSTNANRIYGHEDDDELIGLAGTDDLQGGNGNDTLQGRRRHRLPPRPGRRRRLGRLPGPSRRGEDHAGRHPRRRQPRRERRRSPASRTRAGEPGWTPSAETAPAIS